MARVKNSENLSPVTGSITVELREALENYRWPARKTMSEAVREGLEFWAKDKGIWSPETTGDASVEDDGSVKADGSDADKAAQAEHAEADKAAADKAKTSSSRATK